MENKKLILKTLHTYGVSDDQKSRLILLFTLSFVLASLIGNIYLFKFNIWLAVFGCIPTAIIFCRCLVLEHDSGHYNLFKSRTENKIAGTILGVITMIPAPFWNHIHDLHHRTTGNLNKREISPELWTLTVDEYQKMNALKKLAYRVIRSVIMRLFVTPLLLIIVSRIPFPQFGLKVFMSIILHDFFYAGVLYFVILNSWLDVFLIVYLLPLYLFNIIASVFLYLQHQYEHTYWEEESQWSNYNASLHGSSHLVVGSFWGWVSGHIGCHHTHHLNTKIPSYSLFKATEVVNEHLTVEPIYLKELFFHLNCVLWDDETKKLISFRTLSEKQ